MYEYVCFFCGEEGEDDDPSRFACDNCWDDMWELYEASKDLL